MARQETLKSIAYMLDKLDDSKLSLVLWFITRVWAKS